MYIMLPSQYNEGDQVHGKFGIARVVDSFVIEYCRYYECRPINGASTYYAEEKELTKREYY